MLFGVNVFSPVLLITYDSELSTVLQRRAWPGIINQIFFLSWVVKVAIFEDFKQIDSHQFRSNNGMFYLTDPQIRAMRTGLNLEKGTFSEYFMSHQSMWKNTHSSVGHLNGDHLLFFL